MAHEMPPRTCQGIRAAQFANRAAPLTFAAMISPQTLTGKLLLAMPGMSDPRFARAVVAMAAHDEQGALGIGIGHLVPQMSFRELLDNVGIDPGDTPDAPVHMGGPVEPHRGFVLHSPEWQAPGAMALNPVFGLTASLEALREIAEGRGPRRWLFALGYAGWGAGQLDGEMQRHGWFAGEASERIVFETAAEARWTGVWRAVGIDPAMLANTTGHS